MGFTAAVGAGVSAGGAFSQSRTNQQLYGYQKDVANNNATLAEWQAQDALQRGTAAESNQRLRTAQLKSTQRATLASRGVALDEGSPLDILTTTDVVGELDALTIRQNAQREAWGLRNQAGDMRTQAGVFGARSAAESPGWSAATSLLGSSNQLSSYWYPNTSRGR